MPPICRVERGGFIMNGILGRKLARCRALARTVLALRDRRRRSRCAIAIADLEIDLLALEAAS